ncbi:SDR family NAD(P)-dependent oxidoreductase [Agromyces sp. MMS24-JH15]|uniref:SDR family NAD(P)-dependent oxidoreductase n=1 Tax=Agromyces sp. MMS24-JH15 TaxID=3243765 RepID=UPI003749F3F2
MPEAPDFLRLRGRTILITGASSGIGRATAIAAARHGARVVCVARRADQLDDLVGALEGSGHLAVAFDVTRHAEVAAMMAEVVQQVGRLDGLVHAAGMHEPTPLRVASADQVQHLFDVNVTTAVMLTKAFRHAKVRGESPSVVLLSSAVGLVGEAGVSVYAATKAAVASLAKSFGLELAREGIRVNAIAAGVVSTPLAEGIHAKVGDSGWASIEAAHPLGIGTADDVADAALYLLSPASAWVTGTALVVDGGYTAR